ncbi:M23 family metallopeptidase [Thermoflavimicrobium dichotomicum]|uniref:Murein DD-endopeptidase MepM and murein hydrolase activator NlpD, contain LysM domain n=1 Tax=Thermoflavimicrobium dichotomicum TaxID=46223 RepID=A0A1I3N9I8_9BACL|nr:M23 family metallopeptidase [Thermoflavimicrobium dichotomicum]SFJ05981.1 Murein DD-endopeptidase MepM and murein hydrolase activator NlpD, contain LysM domain [Thermoflavimicrobium dichotomicum]
MNKKWMIIIPASLLMLFIIFFPPEVVWNHSSDQTRTVFQQNPKQAQTTLTRNGITYQSLSYLQKQWNLDTDINEIDGKIILVHGKKRLTLFQEMPVLNVNGRFVPLSRGPIKENNEFWLANEAIRQIEKELKDTRTSTRIPAVALQRVPVHELVDYLSFLKNPIRGAHVSTRDSQLPGAPRPYRNGVHEGIDWYGYTTGVKMTTKTPVLSMADGIIVRADHNYKEMTESERNQLLKKAAELGQTPEYILDKLRGRSVWVQYDKGILARYVHLDRISKKIKVGEKVKTGQLIGYVGNSGTSDGVLGNNEGLHLHLDIFIYGEWFWRYYTMNERRIILEKVFHPEEKK